MRPGRELKPAIISDPIKVAMRDLIIVYAFGQITYLNAAVAAYATCGGVSPAHANAASRQKLVLGFLGILFAKTVVPKGGVFPSTDANQWRITMATATFMERDTARGASAGEHSEGTIAKMIEQQTAKLPSDVFLWAAGGSILGSLMFQLMGDEKKSVFVGQWAPTFLILGLYNKLVKTHGSE
jgi:hypothetical protein